MSNQENEFRELTKRFLHLAKQKIGFPTSFLSMDKSFVNNEILGIKQDSLASILINNVGDPFKESDTWQIETKDYEIKIIKILSNYFGVGVGYGYVTSGGTEANDIAIRWIQQKLFSHLQDKRTLIFKKKEMCQRQIQRLNQTLQEKKFSSYQEENQILTKLNTLNIALQYYQAHLQCLETPILICTKEYTHYSIFKIAKLLHFDVQTVSSNADGSMSLIGFKEKLIELKQKKVENPVIVVANIGSTITGSIDDVPKIKLLIKEHTPDLVHGIHMDGAMLGILLPILKPFGEIDNYLSDADTISFSFHKYFGTPQPCGFVLTTQDMIETVMGAKKQAIEYAGNIIDTTLSGSRSGFNVLLVYNVLVNGLKLDLSRKILSQLVVKDLKSTKYFYREMVGIFGKEAVLCFPGQFNVLFPKPSEEIIKKYQLMIYNDKAVACINHNVDRQLVNQFIFDLITSIRGGETVTKSTSSSDAGHSTTTNPFDFTIHVLSEEHIDAATEIFIQTFCRHEPLVVHLGIQPEEFRPLAKKIMTQAAHDGLSVVAVDDDDKVVGCAVSENFHEPVQIPADDKFMPIFGLFEELSKPIHHLRFTPNTVVHIWITAVDERVQGAGLSTRLNNACVIRAIEQGFKYVYCEFTNVLNERIMKYYPESICLNRIEMQDFEFNGQKPFKALKGHASAYLTPAAPFHRLEPLVANVESYHQKTSDKT